MRNEQIRMLALFGGINDLAFYFSANAAWNCKVQNFTSENLQFAKSRSARA